MLAVLLLLDGWADGTVGWHGTLGIRKLARRDITGMGAEACDGMGRNTGFWSYLDDDVMGAHERRILLMNDYHDVHLWTVLRTASCSFSVTYQHCLPLIKVSDDRLWHRVLIRAVLDVCVCTTHASLCHGQSGKPASDRLASLYASRSPFLTP
ncbi:hypothetical protein VDGL01_12255 [Verticillium dahliae]